MRSIWQRIEAWWRRVTGARPEPGTVEVRPPATDPVVPPVVIVTPPATPVPWQIGPMGGVELWPKHMFVWGEGHGAGDFDNMLRKAGFVKGSRVVVIAKSGRSAIGETARLVWHPVNEPNVRLPEVLARIDAARREGLTTIAVDTEGVACFTSNMRAVKARAGANGLRVIHTPKALLDHLPGSPAEDCAILNETAHATLMWIYGNRWAETHGPWTAWIDIIRMWHDNGLTIQAIPMCDSGRREFDPYNTEPEIIEIIRGCAKCGLSWGVFNPSEDGSMEELREAAKWYGN